MRDDIDRNRRRLLGTAAVTVAAAQLGMIGSADAQSGGPRTNTSFGPLKQIDAGLLNIGYVEAGPAKGADSFSFTAGLTTFTAMSMSRLCSFPWATG